MRRAILIVVVALLAGALPATAASPGADVAAGQLAESFWVDLRSGTFYFAEGYRLASTGTSGGFAAVGKGRCKVHRMGRNGTVISCAGHGIGKEASIEELFIDPALRSAHLDIKIAGHRHVVDWTSDEVPSINWNTAVAGYGAGADLTIGAFALAEGTIFGEKVKSNSFEDMAYLAEGGGALVYTRFAQHPNGTVSVKLRYRV